MGNCILDYFFFFSADIFYLDLNHLADVSKCLALVSQHAFVHASGHHGSSPASCPVWTSSSSSTVKEGFPTLGSTSVMLSKGLTNSCVIKQYGRRKQEALAELKRSTLTVS